MLPAFSFSIVSLSLSANISGKIIPLEKASRTISHATADSNHLKQFQRDCLAVTFMHILIFIASHLVKATTVEFTY